MRLLSRRFALIWAPLWILCGSSAFAETAGPEDWLDMATLCEEILFDQNDAGLEGLAPAEPIVNVDGLPEVAVAHPHANLVASAVLGPDGWFLCLVEAVPPQNVGPFGALIGTWAGTQGRLAKEPGNTSVVFSDGSTFAPVRVRCGEGGHLAVIMAFISDTTQSFRIGVANRLPASIKSPCPE